LDVLHWRRNQGALTGYTLSNISPMTCQFAVRLGPALT
jgi:hypothetical protein